MIKNVKDERREEEFVYVFILKHAFITVSNVTHNKPYGVFICCLVQVYSSK